MKERGFTLIELLVAISITVVMTGMVIVITTESLGFWNRTQSHTTTLAQAQMALDQLEHDLQGAIQRKVDEPWISVKQENALVELEKRGWVVFDDAKIKPNTKPADEDDNTTLISERSFGRGGLWLRFFTTDISSDGGRPVAVSYQINRRVAGSADAATHPQSVRYLLMRSEMNNDASLIEMTAMKSSYNWGTTLQMPEMSDVLALNVVDFGIWFYHRDGSGKIKRIPANAPPYYLPQNDAIPTEADLMVRILSDKGATLVSNIENELVKKKPPEFATDADWWWSIVKANSQVYVRHVNLLNRP